MNELYKKYWLTADDVFKHKHYTIITRSWIEKIQAKAGITIDYEVVWCWRDWCMIKAKGRYGEAEITTLASAVQWWKVKVEVNGTEKRTDLWSTDSWYIAEIAEKRAMSRVVLKLLWLYAEWFFGEDEDVIDKSKREDVDEDEALQGFDKK